MDRIDAMKVFVAALDEGSLAGAARKLGRSPAAVSRAIAFLEARVGAELLHRTTRSIKLSEAGERYLAACRRVLTELEEADIIAAGERSAPRGTLTLTAPVTSGETVLRPILDAFLEAYPTVSARLYLLDRPVNLIEEGIDLALRIAHLPDSTLLAIRAGEVRLVVAAAPRYLAQHPRIQEPGDLDKHQIIAEPVGRNTAPAVGLTGLQRRRRGRTASPAGDARRDRRGRSRNRGATGPWQIRRLGYRRFRPKGVRRMDRRGADFGVPQTFIGFQPHATYCTDFSKLRSRAYPRTGY